MIEALFCQDSLVWQILHCWENCVAENFYNWATRRHLHETSSLSNFWVSTKEVNGLVRYSAWGNYCYCPLFVHLYYFFYREGVLVWAMTNGHILCWSRGCHWVIFIFHCVCHCGSIITQLRSNLVALDFWLFQEWQEQLWHAMSTYSFSTFRTIKTLLTYVHDLQRYGWYLQVQLTDKILVTDGTIYLYLVLNSK